MNKAKDFLARHGMSPEQIVPAEYAGRMAENMRSGLAGHVVDMPMIPCYLTDEGKLPLGATAIVIDAGGTNYRSGLATITENGCEISNLNVCGMPGVGEAVDWEEFVSFVADSVAPLAGLSDRIGFCFSYSADILPNMDALVHNVDKEVVIRGCTGKKIGESLNAELERRGIAPKKIVILNDTVAALLGGSAALDKTAYSDMMGMICGTGANTCCSVKKELISKIPVSEEEGKMLINLESGFYCGFPAGDVDAAVDAASVVPGEKLMEKMCSGAYLGSICRKELEMAAEEGIVSAKVKKRLGKIENFNGAVVDALACGSDPNGIFEGEQGLDFAEEVCKALFERSARCMATNILAIMLLNGSGTDENRPFCVCAEGSLIAKSRYFLEYLREQMALVAIDCGRYAEIRVGRDTTLPGAAAGAILNCG